MAIQRTSDPVQGGAKDTRQYSTPGIAAAQVRPDYVTQVGDTSWKGKLIGDLVGLTTEVAKIGFDNATSDAYLKGAAQAGIDKTEAELQADPFTKDFATAGFRDAMGRLKVAQQEGDLARDMAWLSQKPANAPDGLGAYLAKQRAELMPILEGGSGRNRAAMIPQVALRDQSAIAQHTTAYQGFIFDMRGKSLAAPITTGLNVLTQMREAGASGADYQAQERTIMGKAADLWSDPSLPVKHKSALTKELIEYSLTNKHLGLYEALRDTKMPDTMDEHGNWTATGQPTSILERMDLKTQEALSGAYLKAKETTAALGYQDFMDRMSIEHAAVKNGTSTLDHSQWMAFLDSASRQGLLKQGTRDDMVQDWEKMMYKQTDGITAGTAFLAGDNNTVHAKRGSWQGAKADAEKILQNMPMPQQLERLSSAANIGNPLAAQMFGERITAPIMGLTVIDGKISADNKQALASFHALADNLSKKGPEHLAQLYAGMPEAASFRAQALRALMSEGNTPEVALNTVLTEEKKFAGMTPQAKALLAADTVKADEKYMQEIGTAGWFKRAWWSVSSIAFKDNALRDDLEMNGVLPYSSEDVKNPYARDISLENVRNGMREELNLLSMKGMLTSSEARTTQAMANVIKRTVHTEHGAIMVPVGQTPHKYFGVDAAIPTALIEKAISSQFKPTADGGQIRLTATPNGILHQEFDRNGTPMNSGTLPVENIARLVGVEQKKELAPIREQVGEGITVKHGEAAVTFNGVNTAGISPATMLEFRKDLVKFEGVRGKQYEDLSNKDPAALARRNGKLVYTAGVGVSTTNPKHYPKVQPDGSVTNEDISSSFKGASNEAATLAARTVNSVGLYNKDAFLLFGQLAYQGMGDTGKLMGALRTKDTNAALAAIKETKAYKYSQPERRQRYEQLTLGALKG